MLQPLRRSMRFSSQWNPVVEVRSQVGSRCCSHISASTLTIRKIPTRSTDCPTTHQNQRHKSKGDFVSRMMTPQLSGLLEERMLPELQLQDYPMGWCLRRCWQSPFIQ